MGSRETVATKTVGVIGGSGLYHMEGLEKTGESDVRTPFGRPSDRYVKGILGETKMIFLPRHGRGHRWLPTEINFRANIFGMKKLGVERIISVSAVGSLREDIAPGDVVIPDQFIDRTTQRANTFFGRGIVAHVSLADPICPTLAKSLAQAASEERARVHSKGVYLCMEGPQFSTRAESLLYRNWRADVIGMTNLQEARLAREAEICFATLALVTDYDCWNQTAGDVEIEEVLRVLNENIQLAQRIIRRTLDHLPESRSCACPASLKNAIITDRSKIPKRVRSDLKPIVGKYL